MDYRRTLPFYMTYGKSERPIYGMNAAQNKYRDYYKNTPIFPFQMDMSEEEAMRDLDYLQEMYPTDVKKYQRKISQILNRMDYQGSLIYDDYPDRMTLLRLADEIVDMLKQEEPENTSPEKWQWLGDLILILLFYEIYRRRRMARGGFRNF